MKLSKIIRLFSILAFVPGLISCSSSAIVMESVADPAYNKPLQRVLIVSNGDLFPDATKRILFFPSVDVLQKLFAQHGMKSSTLQVHSDDLNPSVHLLAAAKDRNATHILFFNVSKVTAFGPTNLAESDPRNQYRLVADYTYSLTITDLQTRKNIWKGKLHGGSGSSTEESLRQIEDKLKEHLTRAGLLAS